MGGAQVRGMERCSDTLLLTDDEILQYRCILPLRSIARTTEEGLHVVCSRGFAVHGVIGDTRRARHDGLCVSHWCFFYAGEVVRVCVDEEMVGIKLGGALVLQEPWGGKVERQAGQLRWVLPICAQLAGCPGSTRGGSEGQRGLRSCLHVAFPGKPWKTPSMRRQALANQNAVVHQPSINYCWNGWRHSRGCGPEKAVSFSRPHSAYP
jgi:hypothetical protein